MLKWPTRAKAALRKLFEPLQEIDVYVEDTNDEAFYRCLLNSATEGKVTVARVFGLGGKAAVLAAAATHDHAARRALFIVDGDLPWVRGVAPPNIVGLHQHNAYCVENLLICENAVTLLLSEEGAITEQAAAAALKYQDWRATVLAPLTELFAAFATVSEADPAVPTVSQGAGVLCSTRKRSTAPVLDTAKAKAARDKALRLAEVAFGAEPVAVRYAAILQRIQAMPDPLLAVSGKDFVIPLIDFHLQALGCRIKRRTLRIRLARSGQRARFSALAKSLLFAARGHA
jgi:hypothetical protein